MDSSKGVLQLEIDELENACHHLRRSNEELQAFLNQDPDQTFAQAIKENKGVIEEKEGRIRELKALLQQGVTACLKQPVSTEPGSASDRKEGVSSSPGSEETPLPCVDPIEEGVYL